MTGTNEWQRVDNTGCAAWVLRAFLLSWAVVIPYAVIMRSNGWFAFALACVLSGAWLTLRHRAQRAFEIPEMAVDVVPTELAPGQEFVVSLSVAGDKARTIRWWSSELVADVLDDDPKTMVTAEFAIDPAAENAPVSELRMLLTAPDEYVVRETEAQRWWIRVTVETERGRMESGKVKVRMTG